MHPVSFSANNQITLLPSGMAFFPALIAAIDAAQVEIYLETYIFSSDDIATQVKNALKRAARRGVVVRVIVDWFGTGRTQSVMLEQEFLTASVQYHMFNPWFRRGVARTHRKMCAVDRQLAFVGGVNITDDMYTDDDLRLPLPFPRWDFAISVRGPLVAAIHLELAAQWLRLGNMTLFERLQHFRHARSYISTAPHGLTLAGLVVRDNFRNRRTIQRAYLQALGHARQSVLLTNPYFAPDRKLRRALEEAAQRGVKVILLLGIGHYRLQDAVAHSYYPKLLKAGVEIVEYRKTELHAKVAVIDEDWATVGSSNYDGLSLLLNQEANVVIKDVAFTNVLRRHIEAGIADGIVVKPADFIHPSWYRRIWYGIAFFLYRLVMRVMTIGSNK